MRLLLISQGLFGLGLVMIESSTNMTHFAGVAMTIYAAAFQLMLRREG